MRLSAVEAATRFVDAHFPNCQVALLGGSVVRGEETASSDLDLVIIDDSLAGAYRESFVELGWPIEAFVYNRDAYGRFVEDNRKRARPSLSKMVAEGHVIRDDGTVQALKAEAVRLLETGPTPWTQREIDGARYGITDLLDDLAGSHSHGEDLFIAGKLAVAVHEFVLRVHGQWVGDGKWVVRALRNYDADFCERFVAVFDQFYKRGDGEAKDAVIAWVDEVLAPYGGRHFAGFSIGKAEQK